MRTWRPPRRETQVAGAARNLAGLHGPRWSDPALRGSPALRFADPAGDQSLAGMFPGVLPQVAERLGAALSAEDHATLTDVGAVLSAPPPSEVTPCSPR